MKTFWLALLVQAIKALVGAVAWESVLQAVTDLMVSDLPGEEKRRLVLSQLRLAFAHVPRSLINLAIEVAVAKSAPR